MKKYGYLIGGLSGLFWGVVSILYGFIDTGDSQILNILLPFSIDFLGLIVAGSYVFVKYSSELKFHKSFLLGIISGIIGGPMGMLSYIYAIQNIGAEYSAAISSTYPILCTLFFVFAKKEKINNWTIFGVLLATICSILLGLIGSSALDYQGGGMIGLALFTAVCWATEIILSSHAMKHYNATIIYFARQLGSSLGYAMVLLYFIDNHIFVLSDIDWDIMIVVGIIIFSILSYFLYYQAIYYIPPISALALNITYNMWTILITIILSGVVDNYLSLLLCIGISAGSLLTTIKHNK